MCAIALIPLVTLLHRNDLGRWDVQKSAMAGPDEFSYLLMGQHLLEGGGLSLQKSIGRDTFYPPGYPLLLALWAKLFFGGRLTAFAAHALNTVLLCAGCVVVYFFSRRQLLLLSEQEHRRFHFSPGTAETLALLIAGLFATNWHVLESALLIMSEPAFMLVTLGWLAAALKWPAWHLSPSRALVVVLLAVAAWSIRGAGIVCVAATAAYPFMMGWRERGQVNTAILKRWAPIALAILLPLVYQAAVTAASPEKSITSGEESANSYPRQLLHGLTYAGHGRYLQFSQVSDYPSLAANLGKMVLEHFNDYASSFVPWPRENPDLHFRDLIGKIMGILGLSGWLFHATRGSTAAPNSQGRPLRFLELYVLLYMSLYLVWPFDFARFWSPIMPVMLVYAADAMIQLGGVLPRVRMPSVAAVLLGLLLVLSGEEVYVQLGNYARRLNDVSTALADGVAAIIRRSPDPAKTIVATMDGDTQFGLAWYFSQAAGGNGFRVRSPEPHLAAKGGAGEHADEMLLRSLNELNNSRDGRLFFFSYFPQSSPDTRDTIKSVEEKTHDAASFDQVFRHGNIASVWKIELKRPAVQSSTGRQ